MLFIWLPFSHRSYLLGVMKRAVKWTFLLPFYTGQRRPLEKVRLKKAGRRRPVEKGSGGRRPVEKGRLKKAGRRRPVENLSLELVDVNHCLFLGRQQAALFITPWGGGWGMNGSTAILFHVKIIRL